MKEYSPKETFIGINLDKISISLQQVTGKLAAIVYREDPNNSLAEELAIDHFYKVPLSNFMQNQFLAEMGVRYWLIFSADESVSKIDLRMEMPEKDYDLTTIPAPITKGQDTGLLSKDLYDEYFYNELPEYKISYPDKVLTSDYLSFGSSLLVPDAESRPKTELLATNIQALVFDNTGKSDVVRIKSHNGMIISADPNLVLSKHDSPDAKLKVFIVQNEGYGDAP